MYDTYMHQVIAITYMYTNLIMYSTHVMSKRHNAVRNMHYIIEFTRQPLTESNDANQTTQHIHKYTQYNESHANYTVAKETKTMVCPPGLPTTTGHVHNYMYMYRNGTESQWR